MGRQKCVLTKKSVLFKRKGAAHKDHWCAHQEIPELLDI